MTAETPTAAPWDTTARCAGSPGLMDAPMRQGGRNSRDLLITWARPLIAEFCGSCPLTGRRGPCDQAVRPAASYHDGIAAGALWIHGKRVRT